MTEEIKNQQNTIKIYKTNSKNYKKQLEKLKKEKKVKKDDVTKGQIESSYDALQVTYSNLMEELKELLLCPILLVKMDDPCITSSGHTIDGDLMQQYIQNGDKDPWDNTMICDRKVRNLLAYKLKILVDQYIDLHVQNENYSDADSDSSDSD